VPIGFGVFLVFVGIAMAITVRFWAATAGFS
jgi:hypothetical protein